MQKIYKLIAPYLILLILTLLSLTFILKPYGQDLKIPFEYSNDSLSAALLIKTVQETGWYLENYRIGTPFGLKMQDYPLSDGLNILMIKFLSLLTDEYGLLMNLFFILTFILVSFSAYFAIRCIGISIYISIFCALLYSFLPYHFHRGETHLFLSAYYIVPLVALICLWILQDIPIFVAERINTKKNEKILNSPRSLFVALVSLLVGSTGVYYAFFGCFLIGIAGIGNLFKSRSKSNKLANLTSSFIIILLISTSVLVNVSPSLLYWHENGKNQLVSQRLPFEADLYGQKIAHLILPITGHRIPILKNLKEKYFKANFSLDTENAFSSLGSIGTLGFLLLLGCSLFSLFDDWDKKQEKLQHLATLNLSALLFSTIGSFGSLFNLYVSPQIRAYNRISVFIAFFSLLAVAIVMQRYLDSLKPNTLFKKKLIPIFLTIFLCLGILDQTSNTFVPKYTEIKESFLRDKSFFRELENQLPAQAMIFQLPYLAFPEAPPPSSKIGSYGLLKGYLHTQNLKWSFGSMQGRNGDWHQWVSQKEIPQMLSVLVATGFRGVCLSRDGYLDRGIAVESIINQYLGSQHSKLIENSENVCFDLDQINKIYEKTFSKPERDYYHQLISTPLEQESLDFIWQAEGFYPEEQDSSSKWRWAKQRATLEIRNSSISNQDRELKIKFATGWTETSKLDINSDLFQESIEVNQIPKEYKIKVSIPPGKHLINFFSDAKQVNAPQDSRILFFKVINFKILREADNLVEKINQKLFSAIEKKGL